MSIPIKMMMAAAGRGGDVSGNLYSWGEGEVYELGHGSSTDFSSPVQVGSLVKWAYISTGLDLSVGIRTDGTLWSWGLNDNGQCGLGNTSITIAPMQVGTLTNWSKVTIAQDAFMAIKTDGTLWSCGYNFRGQLGDGSTTTRSSPVQIGALTTWASIAGGALHFKAIKTDGTLWHIGSSAVGGSGMNNTTNYSSPVQIGALTTWANVSCGDNHTFAVTTGGALFSWGNGGSGQLGHNSTITYSSPVQVGSLTNWSTVSGGAASGHAIKTDGTLWRLGGISTNGEGGTGTSGSADISSPIQVGSLTDWAELAQGGPVTRNRGARKTDGTIWMWGANDDGELGLGNTTELSSPVQLGARTDWATVVAGGHTGANYGHVHFLDNAGILYSSGAPAGAAGMIGNGTLGIEYSSPVQVGSHSKVVEISNHSYGGAVTSVRRADGTIWAWGDNNFGILGDGTQVDKSFPVQVGTETDWINVTAGGGSDGSVGFSSGIRNND